MSIRTKKSGNCNAIQLIYAIKEGRNNYVMHHLNVSHKFLDYSRTSRRTLLHHAVQYRNKPIVQHLMSNGWPINAKDKYGVTPLLIAVKKGDLEIVDMLLRSGADIYITDYLGISTLEYVVQQCIFVETKQSNFRNLYILEWFFTTVNKDFLENKSRLLPTLLNGDFEVQVATVIFGNEQLTKYMLENKDVISERLGIYEYTPLHWAIKLAKLVNARVLIEHGANIQAETILGHTPFYYYTSECQRADRNSELLKLWLAHVQVKTYKSSEIELLMSDGNKQTVKTLLQSRIELPKTFQFKRTPLILLAMNEIEEIFDVLDELEDELAFDLNVNARDVDGATALYYAAYHLRVKQVQFLLKHGADPNLKLSSGVAILKAVTTTVHYKCARELNSQKIVRLLLQHGAHFERQLIYDYYTIHNKPLTALTIISHLALLEILDKSPLIGNKNELAIYQTSNFNWSMKILESMKKKVLHENVTLMQLLSESDQKLVAYTRNEELMLAIKHAKKTVTPYSSEAYYFETISKRIAKASEISKLSGKAALIIEELTGLSSDYYYYVVYKIINYLNLYDLRNLCKIENIDCMQQ